MNGNRMELWKGLLGFYYSKYILQKRNPQSDSTVYGILSLLSTEYSYTAVVFIYSSCLLTTLQIYRGIC